MFQFPGFALNPYGFRVQYLHLTPCSASAGSDPALTIQRVEGGFPHSEILGSKLVRSSPRLIAAYHVLHRLSAPRHPQNALVTLDHSHDPCPPPNRVTNKSMSATQRSDRRSRSAPLGRETDHQKDQRLGSSRTQASLLAKHTHPKGSRPRD